MTSSVPLERRFVPVPSAYLKDKVPLDELLPHLNHRDQWDWPALLALYRVVILADAGAGKTFELKAAAQRLVACGHRAFFLRLEDIGETFGEAFEIGAPAEFQTWLGGNEDAWFFLDSVDELRLSEPRAFEDAIRAFADRIGGKRQRAHVILSSRPHAWNPALDQALLNDVLPHHTLREEVAGEDLEPGQVDEWPSPLSPHRDNDHDRSLRVFFLSPLGRSDMAVFAAHRGVAEPDRFLAALERRNLLSLASTPFDLQDLIDAWLHHDLHDTRLEILRGSVRRLLDKAVAALPGTWDCELALGAVRLLAVAATFTGLSNFRLPGLGGKSAMDPNALLPGWDCASLEVLLTSGLFGDPVFGEVRFRHREVRDLLAAEWIECQFAREGGRERLNPLIFRPSHDCEILPARLRPLLPWLILYDPASCERILDRHPEIAIEGGDAASLVLAVRQRLLDTLLQCVIDPASHLRGLDNSAIARIAQPDLEDQVLGLIASHRANDEALFLLGRLVWQGELARCAVPLAAVAADQSRGIYARMVSIRAVATVGTAEQLHTMWRAINALPQALPRRLLAELAEFALVDADTVELLLASIEILEPRAQFEANGLTQALNNFIERAACDPADATGGRLMRMAEGLENFLSREPHIERGECRVSEPFQWLISPALHAVERLIAARSLAAFNPPCLAILHAVPALRFWRSGDIGERKSTVGDLVPNWTELNDKLFWFTVEQYRLAKASTGGRLVDDWPITVMNHFWAFGPDSFERTLGWISSRDFADDRQLALARSFTTYVQAGRPAAWLKRMRRAVAGDAALTETLALKLKPPVSEESERFAKMDRKYKRDSDRRERSEARNRAKFVAEMRANPDVVRHPPPVKRGHMSGIHYHLLSIVEGEGHRTTRTAGAAWQALIPEFGVEVAEAYRDAAVARWRKLSPGLRSEGTDTSRVPYDLIFAMAGLDIELAAPGAAVALSASQARRAFRYAIWELNGFPRWFETLYRARPKLGHDFLWAEIQWELANSPSGEPLHYVLHDLVYYAPWLHEKYGPLLFDWLSRNQAPSTSILGYLRTVIVGGKGVTAAQVAALARQRLHNVSTPDDQLPIWWALWVDTEPASAIQALEAFADSNNLSSLSQFAPRFLVALLGGHSDLSPTHVFGAFKTPTFLKQLYLLMHRLIPVSDDIDRAGGGVYSPTTRDDAQEARERLFALLDQTLGPLSYAMICQLAVDHPVPHYRDYMKARAYEHAVQDGDLAAWKVAEVADFANRLAALPMLAPGAGSPVDAAH